MRTKQEWKQIEQNLLSEFSERFPTVVALAKYLGIPQGTIRDAIYRGDLSGKLVVKKDIANKNNDGFSFEESGGGNEATIKYKNAEPLTPKEVLELAEIDTSIWKVESHKINMWQVGAKSEEKNLKWEDGAISGYVKNDGKINKTYLYQIDIKLTRIKRIAVQAIFQPLNFSILTESRNVDFDKTGIKILFIADPHFGFRRTPDGMTPIHSRTFINSLLTVADFVKPNITIWNGDVLDLADFGHFDTKPELLNNTQMAGVELGWVLGQFRQLSKRQIVIEGNHEKRLEKAIIKNLAAGYQLKPIHDLGGHPLMSVPRFLGLESLDTEWIGDYPNGSIKIGKAKFHHGNVVRKGSSKTVSAMINDITSDRFFGHIHRFEMAQKYIEDEGRSVWVGSPGCACDKIQVPGADSSHNWQLGAFLIQMSKESGNVENVEHISSSVNGPTFFRGLAFQHRSYLREFRESLPGEYADWFGSD